MSVGTSNFFKSSVKSVSERLDTVDHASEPGQHSLQPERIAKALRHLGARSVGAIKRQSEILEELRAIREDRSTDLIERLNRQMLRSPHPAHPEIEDELMKTDVHADFSYPTVGQTDILNSDYLTIPLLFIPNVDQTHAKNLSTLEHGFRQVKTLSRRTFADYELTAGENHFAIRQPAQFEHRQVAVDSAIHLLYSDAEDGAVSADDGESTRTEQVAESGVAVLSTDWRLNCGWLTVFN